MIDTSLGDKYKGLICEDCKARVREETNKLSWIDKVRPTRVMRKFQKILCKECMKKVIRGIKDGR